jgi:hypothetical protein
MQARETAEHSQQRRRHSCTTRHTREALSWPLGSLAKGSRAERECAGPVGGTYECVPAVADVSSLRILLPRPVREWDGVKSGQAAWPCALHSRGTKPMAEGRAGRRAVPRAPSARYGRHPLRIAQVYTRHPAAARDKRPFSLAGWTPRAARRRGVGTRRKGPPCRARAAHSAAAVWPRCGGGVGHGGDDTGGEGVGESKAGVGGTGLSESRGAGAGHSPAVDALAREERPVRRQPRPQPQQHVPLPALDPVRPLPARAGGPVPAPPHGIEINFRLFSPWSPCALASSLLPALFLLRPHHVAGRASAAASALVSTAHSPQPLPQSHPIPVARLLCAPATTRHADPSRSLPPRASALASHTRNPHAPPRTCTLPTRACVPRSGAHRRISSAAYASCRPHHAAASPATQRAPQLCQ